MVSIRRLGKTITGIFRCQGNIRLSVDVAAIEVRGAYCRRQLEDGTDIIPPD